MRGFTVCTENGGKGEGSLRKDYSIQMTVCHFTKKFWENCEHMFTFALKV